MTRIAISEFGSLSTGEQAQLFTLTNRNGMQVKITNYGAIIVSIFTFDKTQRLADIVLGYDNVADYQDDSYYLGAVIGRYAGRIENGTVTINDRQYQLTLNAPDSQLHGGKIGLNKRLWHGETHETDDAACLSLHYISPDGEEGYPGEVTFTVNYTLNDNNELIVDYFATTTQTTIVNLTQHSYFNLAGHNSGNIHQHQVAINADTFLPMTTRAYPSGELCSVKNTVHDFTAHRELGKNIDSEDLQIKIGHGYDNYWLLNDNALTGQEFAAQVIEPHSGRRMTLFTDQPSIILYTANYIDGSHIGKNNYRYQKRAALCLEPQRANNKQNGVTLNNALLTPEQAFHSQSRYRFDVI